MKAHYGGSNPSSPATFYIKHIVIYVQDFAELAVLAMSMFLAAFFCLKVLFIPQNAYKAIEKIHEVEETLSEKRPSDR